MPYNLINYAFGLSDMPFSTYLDENLREDMRSLVLSLQKEFGMTVLLVPHDREDAFSMSHRVAVMFQGELLQIGTPEEVYALPDQRSAYRKKHSLLSNDLQWFLIPNLSSLLAQTGFIKDLPQAGCIPIGLTPVDS